MLGTSNDPNGRIVSLKEHMLQMSKNVKTLVQQNERLLRISSTKRQKEPIRNEDEENREEEESESSSTAKCHIVIIKCRAWLVTNE
jgi:hypothetical protein